ncbi:hypothetical protein AVEN_62815-1 [Araneus ventricosus]|uniref:Uncharacterized protein n=1 Tax=Araneus ventricosus TaxID=182803 RepID=A0A4Y2IDF2_ARAVE|nr:hypothetical protein AVEN_62815-1 [Araneus ventricosus]
MGDHSKLFMKLCSKNPFPNSFRYTDHCWLVNNPMKIKLLTIFEHYVPAMGLDLVLLLKGKKPRSPSAAAISTASSTDMPISYLFLCPPLLSEIPFYCPPLQEIPFVSKTICLSVGYFLSDSEALALPNCRTFIYAMEPTKQKCVLLKAPYLEKGDQSNDSGSVTVTELYGLLKQIPRCGNCEEDDVSSRLDCDADDALFQMMSDDEIIAKVRKPK